MPPKPSPRYRMHAKIRLDTEPPMDLRGFLAVFESPGVAIEFSRPYDPARKARIERAYAVTAEIIRTNLTDDAPTPP